MNDNYERFVFTDIEFKGEGIEKNNNEQKKDLKNLLKNESIVTIKTRKGLIKIKNILGIKNGILYDYVGNKIGNDNDIIYFNNDEIEEIKYSKRGI